MASRIHTGGRGGGGNTHLNLLPSFALTHSPPGTVPESPILYLSTKTFHARILLRRSGTCATPQADPLLPQHCAHTLRPFVPLTKCELCEIQILACETWWKSRNHDGMAMLAAVGSKRLLCVPQVPPAECTPTIRSIYYALGLPLGNLDESCID